MEPFKLDEMQKMSKAERMAQLKELEAELEKFKEERSLPGAKVTYGAPNKLSELEEVSRKHKAALREAYRNREPIVLDLRHNSRKDPSCTAASPPGVTMRPAFSEDGEGKQA